MEAREQRGLVIAACKKIKQKGRRWLVPSQTDSHKTYSVCVDPQHEFCTCPDHEETGGTCKHIYAVRYTIEREYSEDGKVIAETQTVTVRKTYSQNWPAYNSSQVSEKEILQVLLHDLCKSVPESTANRIGRPRLPLRDGVFSACLKVYSQLSSRRFQSDLRDAHDKGFISRVPHFNSVLNVFDSEDTPNILKALIAKSAEPLAAVETNFAIDSSGFSGCRFDRWFEEKWGNPSECVERTWVKAHAMVGVTTNIVAAVDVLDKNSGDSTQLPGLLQTTAERFSIGDLCADKAYLSHRNLQVIADAGGTPFIPFKSNNRPSRPGLWNDAYHFFHLHREEFLARYHQRSISESVFSAVKRKFGDSVKAKNDTSMQSEVLAKFLCHNLCCLIQAMNEFGIDPSFHSAKLA